MNKAVHHPEAVQQKDLARFDPGQLFPKLRFGIYRFTFKVQGQNNLSGYLGSAWRGMLGWSLQELCCPWDNCPTGGCPLFGNCPWYLLFARESDISGFRNPPRPYILMPVGNDDSRLQLDLVLVGNAVELLPAIIEALEHGGRSYGLRCRGRNCFFSLQSVASCLPDRSWAAHYDGDENMGYDLNEWLISANHCRQLTGWKTTILTPLRLRKKNSYLDRIDWIFAFSTLAIRLDILNQSGGGVRMDRELWDNLKILFSDPGRITMSADHWNDWHRYSSPQKRSVPMGGRVGKVRVEPPPGRENVWFRWWRTAELLHLGKGTTMGNGCIHLHCC